MEEREMSEQGPDNTRETNDRPADSGESWRTRREYRHEWRREHRISREPLRGLFWGLFLILIGVLFFINQQGEVSWDILWKYLLIGLGAIFIIDGLIQTFYAEFRNGSLGKFIPGIVLIFVGVAFLFNFSQWWPVILIAVGGILLISILIRRR
jgi:hypothetical protein